MSTPKEPTADTLRLQALAKTLSDILRQRFGTKQFYTADEVESACNQAQVPASVRGYVVAMFVEPEQTKGFLQKLGSSKTAIELRKFLAGQIFFRFPARCIIQQQHKRLSRRRGFPRTRCRRIRWLRLRPRRT